ncbi:MAG: ferredoxin [Phycisphaerales bacterium]|nr:ferredoxin [Phycisphaerales bacterium]
MAVVESLAIAIDQEECIGCSACVTEAPETFDMNDDDKAYVKNPPHDELEFIMAAAESCPIEAITITDSAEGKQLFPSD